MKIQENKPTHSRESLDVTELFYDIPETPAATAKGRRTFLNCIMRRAKGVKKVLSE